MADTLRAVAFVLGCVSLGTMLALYERVGRFVLPKTTIRLLILASGLLVVTMMLAVADRLGEPLGYRVVLALLTLCLYLTALVRLYRYFSTEEGRRQRHELVNEYAAAELSKLADLARAVEDDPEHLGRYVRPTWIGRTLAFFGARGVK